MSKFWVFFVGSVPIEAETQEEAEGLFWDGAYNGLDQTLFISSVQKEED